MRCTIITFTLTMLLVACQPGTSAIGPVTEASPIPFSTVQKVQLDVATATAKINSICAGVNSVAALAQPFSAVPAVGVLESFAGASCGNEPAIAALVQKAVNDPTTIAWGEDLYGKLKSAVAQFKKI